MRQIGGAPILVAAPSQMQLGPHRVGDGVDPAIGRPADYRIDIAVVDPVADRQIAALLGRGAAHAGQREGDAQPDRRAPPPPLPPPPPPPAPPPPPPAPPATPPP